MNSGILKINEYYKTFTKQEKKLADFLLKNINEASVLTISELSKKSGVSCSTINRFAITLGYKGFKEFIRDMYHEANSLPVQENVYEINHENPLNMDIDTVIKVVCNLNIESIRNSLMMIEETKVLKAIEAIHKAPRVVVYALSGSVAPALDLKFKFQRLGINCEVYDNPHSLILSATTLKSKDVVIALSYTGETKEILDALKYVKENGAKIIGITMVGNNSLSKICDICIEHSSVDKGLRTYSTRSRVVQENIIDILYIGLCTKRKGFLERYYSLFAKDKEDKNNK
ncbi:MAG: MurR/RpiR family transcriptional regulator [Candidatus Onthovivens sp.]|nr:MurR/RpiR family transcriptional regulator [Mollicutes bacterium]MDD7621643.1 MurR/RpiR family transcriptional regulator [Bacilli bacterium]MDY3995011.1 MurR/RpiR family transcriptional regulator [Candidatus Onthovivens sp.]MDY5892823.1 MurR/RpiR family transcriptional regulator [Candidatus Onthovivens sp.]MDY6058515.1 MurR/RpiR family transcriptional regulator [Candidatus Onthovivens sp.]